MNENYAFVTVTVPEPISIQGYIGMDRNTADHVAVVGNPTTGKVWKPGKKRQHIHEMYKNTRRELQKQGRHKEVKELRGRENRIIKDINHKVSKKMVEIAVRDACGIKLEDLDGIRDNRKQASSFKYSLHGWSFHQLQQDIEYKARLNGHVDHANASFNIALRPSLEEGYGRSHADRDACKGRIDAPQEATA